MIRLKVNEFMKAKGLSMLVLSEMTGISYTAILRFCKNQITRIDCPTLETLCRFFECEPCDLIEYIKEDVNKPNENGIKD